MTSSTLALDSDSGGYRTGPGSSRSPGSWSCFISPSTASMSSCDVTTTQARRRQIVPSSSVIVCRLSIRWESVPMNWPTSSTRKTSRCCGPLESRYSFDPLAEVLDGQGEAVLGPVDPLLGGCLALAESFAERLDHLIPVELVGVPLLRPIRCRCACR